jgi:outer membrane protein assembly factor BamB
MVWGGICFLGLAPLSLALNLWSAEPGTHSSASGLAWTQFRGDTGQGISLATNVPVYWGARSNVVWKMALPGKGWSSPVLREGRLYLTTAVEEGGEVLLRVLCLDAGDGKTVWATEVFKADPAGVKLIHTKNSLASPTPVLSGDRLYVHFGHLGTAALDLGGRVIWRQAGLKYEPMHGNGGSPVLVDGLLVFSCDGQKDPEVVALDAATGQVRWRTPRNTPARNKFSFGTPLVIQVDGVTQVIAPGSGFVAGYVPATGRELWRVRYGEGYSVITRPVFAHGLLFVSSSYDRPVLYAIRPQGASGDATATHVAWTAAKGVPNTPSCLVVGDEVYYVADSGVATCADARTGTVHWNERLGGGYSASPFVAEGRIYFQNEAGVGVVVKAGKKFELLANNDVGDRSLATPLPADNALYIRTAGFLFKVGKP